MSCPWIRPFLMLCVLCAEMAENSSTAWAKRIIPINVTAPAAGQPDRGHLEDFQQLQAALVQEEWAPYEAEAAVLQTEAHAPAQLFRSVHSSSVVCQSLSDLIQVRCYTLLCPLVMLQQSPALQLNSQCWICNIHLRVHQNSYPCRSTDIFMYLMESSKYGCVSYECRKGFVTRWNGV